MRKNTLMLTALICFITACNKSDNTDNNNKSNNYFGNTPTANQQYDNTAAGIYKGVTIGSSGYFVIYIKNQEDKVFALLNFDNIKDSLICPSLNSYNPGSNTNISNAIFTSALGTKDSLILSVNGNGSNPSIKVIIPGHSTYSSINKETSTSVVKLYQGASYDTLVAGYFQTGCGPGGTRYYPLTLKVSLGNAALQNNIVTFISGDYYIPSGSCNNRGSQTILQMNANNQLDFNADPGCSNARAIINITDTAIFGTSICPRPYTTGSCQDAYNSYIRAVRIR